MGHFWVHADEVFRQGLRGVQAADNDRRAQVQFLLIDRRVPVHPPTSETDVGTDGLRIVVHDTGAVISSIPPCVCLRPSRVAARLCNVELQIGWRDHTGIRVTLYARELGNAVLGEAILKRLYVAAMHMREMGNVDDVFDNVTGFGADA